MAESLGEKTEDATPKKLEQARERGQVAKSQDLGAAIGLVVGVVLVLVFGGFLTERMGGFIRRVLEHEMAGSTLDGSHAGDAFVEAVWFMVLLVTPIMVLAFVAAYAVQFIQVGWIFTLKPVQPDLSRISPIKGVKRLFDTKNLVKTLVNVLKLIAAIGLTWALLDSRMGRLAALPALDVRGAMWLVGVTVLELAAVLALLLFVLAVADWLYQRWQFKRDQRMTKQEVRDERRNMEGDIETKRRRARMYAEIVRQQIRGGTPTADVVVTNPTHFSVAIKYDGATMHAPVVVAKGADLLAFQIRQIAASHGIPLVERPPLARALYHGAEVGQPVAPEHYEAVAEVLAYVYRIDADARRRAGVGAA
jgi:flagellar biosynthetic protein FlhB